MIALPGTKRVRLALLMLPLVITLAGAPPGAANPSPVLQVPHGSLIPAGAGTVLAGAATGASVPAAVASAVEETPASDGREDLTVFFTIGAILDVLLVVAFLIWATGQWRKAKK